MFAAALIPLMFIVGLLGVLALGAWPNALVPTLVVGTLLVMIAAMLAKFVNSDDEVHPVGHHH